MRELPLLLVGWGGVRLLIRRFVTSEGLHLQSGKYGLLFADLTVIPPWRWVQVPAPPRLPHSIFVDQIAQSCSLDRSQIQEFHSERLSANPPNDCLVNMHAPVRVWGEDP